MIYLLLCLIFSFDYLEDIHILQANRYNLERYINWQKQHFKLMNISLKKGCFILSFFVLSRLFAYEQEQLLNTLFLLLILFFTLKREQKLPKNQPLIYTKRIKRLLTLLICFVLLITSLIALFPFTIYPLVLLMGIFHSYFLLLVAMMAQPMERRIKRLYRDSAVAKLIHCPCIKIGITGSYGKSSVKNILNEVLSTRYLCCPTPLSYNNEMGITKTILEKLTVFHEIFICEMGADHLHEIEDLCHLVQPTIGIISAIGPQHLSTFHSMENILHEKLQLIESLPATGVGILNNDNQYLRTTYLEVRCRLVTIGIHHPADFKASNIKCNATGCLFDVTHHNQTKTYQIPLLGEHNILNCLMAIAVAVELKVDDVLVHYALAHLTPIPHRLELKSYAGATLIDNAYNSNPDSALASLKVLNMMEGHHFIITPGFIDLADSHEAYSETFGEQIAKYSDTVLLVGTNVTAIKRGCIRGGMRESSIIHTQTMKEALYFIKSLVRKGDTILIENDLPDIFL